MLTIDIRSPFWGSLAHLPWHVVKKRSKSLWQGGWTLLFTLSFLFVSSCLLSGLYITMWQSNCKVFLWNECTPPHQWHELGHLSYLGHKYVSRRTNRSVDQGSFISHDSLALGPTLPCGLASTCSFCLFQKNILSYMGSGCYSLDNKIKEKYGTSTQNAYLMRARNTPLNIFWSFVTVTKMTYKII